MKHIKTIWTLLVLCVASCLMAQDVVSVQLCQPGTYLFGCETFSETGVYSVDVGGQIKTLDLRFGTPSAPTTVNAEVFESETFLWGCEKIAATTAGDVIGRTLTLTNISGCDSVVNLNLKVKAAAPCTPDAVTVEATIKEGETYLWQCEKIVAKKADLNAEGFITRQITLTNIFSCDSVVTLKLSIADDVCPTALPDDVLKNLPALTAQAGKLMDVTVVQDSIMKYYNANWNSSDPGKNNVTGLKWKIMDGTANGQSIEVPVAREWSNLPMTVRFSLVAGADCDVVGGDIKIDKVEPVEIDSSTVVRDTVCLGSASSYATSVVVLKDTVWRSEPVQVPSGTLLPFVDSICIYEMHVFHTAIPQPSDDVIAAQKPVEGTAFDAAALLADVQAKIDADELFARNTKLTVQIKEGDEWKDLTADNNTPAEGAEKLTLRIVGTSDCGNLETAELTSIDVAKKPVEPVYGEDAYSVCPGDSVLYNDIYYKANDVAYSVTLKSLVTGGDSIVALTVSEYGTVLPEMTFDMPHVICGHAFDIAALNKQIEDALKEETNFSPNVKFAWEVLGEDGKWAAYTTGDMPAGVDSISFRVIVSSDCGVLDTLSMLNNVIETPTPENLVDHADLPAGVKYDNWVVMINRKMIREKFKELKVDFDSIPQTDVVWYEVNPTGDDKEVGRGYYYTNKQSALVGEYYAKINVEPTPLDPCGSVWRTVTVKCTSASKAPQLYPTRVAGGETMHLIYLDPNVESAIRIYDAAGRLLKDITSQGESEMLISAENMQGLYMVKVESETQKVVLRYVVVK